MSTVVKKKRRIPRNSKIITRERVLSVLAERLKQPGKISLNECWRMIVAQEKYISYSVLCYIYRDIMSDMIQLGHARRTIRNGIYEIIKRANTYDPMPDPLVKEFKQERMAIRFDEQPEVEEVEFVRPPAKYGNTTREETIEKYLSIEI